VLVSRCSAGEASDAAPTRRDVGRMFQQHKLLMEAGFSYDQASLILEITERRAAGQPADAGTSLQSSLAAATCCRHVC
jgi:ABC-type ATPase involved in cell division